MEARATVEKAKDYLRQLKGLEALEKEHQEQKRKEENNRQRKERDAQLRHGRQLLLMDFDALHQLEDTQQRGTILEDFLNRYFTLFNIHRPNIFIVTKGVNRLTAHLTGRDDIISLIASGRKIHPTLKNSTR